MSHETSAALFLLLFALSTTACDGTSYRRVHAQKRMTWACAPDRYMPSYPEAQHVRLRYVESPRYEEVVAGKGLCDRLTANAKDVVSVDFEAWGDWWRGGLGGFRIVAIDGEKIVNAGGFGSSGVTGEPGPHPLAEYFK